MPTIRVSQKYAAALEAGLKEFETRTGLKRSSVERVRTGGKNIADATKRNYRKHYDGLYQFAAMIGAYGTCFALSYYAPTDFCPSADDDVVALYMMYKSEPKATILLRKDQQATEVLDIFQTKIICRGDWNDPGNCDQFLSAISRLHGSQNNSGQYHPSCECCIRAWKEQKPSCFRHPNAYRVWKKGNPRTSESVQNAYMGAKRSLGDTHVVKGSCQLKPREVHAIRSNLLSRGKLDDLQMFCIMLTSIYLLLRHDEFHLIRVFENICKSSNFPLDNKFDRMACTSLGFNWQLPLTT
jgi:hypothetical protein